MMMKNENAKGFYVLLLMLLGFCPLWGQVNLRLNVATYDNSFIESVELLVQEGDSIQQFSVIKSQEYVLTLPKAGKYSIELSHPSYEAYRIEGFFSNDSTLNVVLKQRAIGLKEVVVEEKARPKVTATGEIFKLSRKAKSSKNPFVALSEIPLLQVDISSQSIKMRSGESPLILIDGHLVNSGVQPILPENIESVEVSEVVSARYLQMGFTKIVNIHLRESIPLYSYIDFRSRHDIPLREGFGGANFEFGKKTFALSGGIFTNYLTKDRVRYETVEQMEQQTKQLSGIGIAQSREADGDLLVKWLPKSSDYFSALLKTQRTRNETERTHKGLYNVSNKSVSLNTASNEDVLSGGFLAALFHEHTFHNQSTLTTLFKYNYGFYDLKQNYSEMLEKDTTKSLVDLATLRHQYALSIDYDSDRQQYGTIAIGNNLEYTQDQIKNQSFAPSLTAYVGLWSNYTHATYSNQWKRLYYMASIGLQSLAVKAADKNHSYWRPRAAVSMTFQLPSQQTVRGSYYLTNKLPESRNLVSFNQSTNPWMREEGNPYLIPMQIHQLDLNYDYSFSDFRIQLFGSHQRYSQMIEPYIRQEGTYLIKSFQNKGTYKHTNGGVNVSYGGEDFQISATTDYSSEAFNGQNPLGSYGIRGYFRWDFGDFFIYSSLSWRNRSYTSISQTIYKNPMEAHIQIAWQATEQLYFSLGLPYFWGTRKDVTQINQPSYSIDQHSFYDSSSLRPWLLISWTLRKNAKMAIPRKLPNM